MIFLNLKKTIKILLNNINTNTQSVVVVLEKNSLNDLTPLFIVLQRSYTHML